MSEFHRIGSHVGYSRLQQVLHPLERSLGHHSVPFGNKLLVSDFLQFCVRHEASANAVRDFDRLSLASEAGLE